MSKKITIGSFLLIICSILTIYLSPYIISQFRYTSADLENNYNQGFQNGIGDSTGIIAEIDKYKKDIEDLIKLRDSKKEELNVSKEKLKMLEDKLESLENESNLVETELQRMEMEIEILTKDLDYLNNQISFYNDLISSIQEESRSTISFMDDDGTVIGVLTCVNGEILEDRVDVSSTVYREFLGWYINDTLIDLDSYVFNENTTLTARYQYRYDVHFIYDEETTQTVIVDKNGTAMEPDLPENIYSVSWWTTVEDTNTKVDFNTYLITGETTFVAKSVKHYFMYTYYDMNGEIQESHREVEGNKVSIIPSNPTNPVGYEFIDWQAKSTGVNLGNGYMNYYVGDCDESFYPIFMKPTILVSNISILNTELVTEDWPYGGQTYTYTYYTNAEYYYKQSAYGTFVDYWDYQKSFKVNAKVTLSNGITVEFTDGLKGFKDGIYFDFKIVNSDGNISIEMSCYSGVDFSDYEFYKIENFEITSIIYSYV